MIETIKKYWWIIAIVVAVFVLSALVAPKLPDIQSEVMAGLAGISFLGQSGQPRGIRNNNPGNLTRTSIPWQGKIPLSQNTDGRFEQFRAFWFGVRAMYKDIKNDITKDGADTIAKLMQTYAPTNENNTEGYINTLVNKTGIQRNTTLNPGDVDQMYKLISAIAEVENGKSNVISREMFEYAYQRA